MGKIKTFLQNPQYFITSPAAKGWLDWVPDRIYLKVLYRVLTGEKCNLKNPITYNEKLQWLKLHDRKPEYADMVDKYEVRKVIRKKVGEEYLIPCYGVYDRFEDIDFNQLPEQFVLKCTHDSGSVVICKDKNAFDKEAAKQSLNAAMKRNYYSTYREWPYKFVKPRIIAEKFMVDESGDDLKDYKVMCFHGRAQVIEVHENRFTTGKEHTQTFYDRDWNKLSIVQEGLEFVKEERKAPPQLGRILELSEKVAQDMYHARVDWYIINDRIYFGEITFYDGSGFETFPNREDNVFLGQFICLDK